MTKINWNKDRKNRLVHETIRSSIIDSMGSKTQPDMVRKGLWPINGKHKGKKITSLETSYLEFIKRTFRPTSLAHAVACEELEKRERVRKEKIKKLRQNKKSP